MPFFNQIWNQTSQTTKRKSIGTLAEFNNSNSTEILICDGILSPLKGNYSFKPKSIPSFDFSLPGPPLFYNVLIIKIKLKLPAGMKMIKKLL